LVDKALFDKTNLILVGATGRNSGKTNAACALIERLKKYFEITALKVTTADHSGAGGCQRGEEGCGACTFTEPFVLQEELELQSGSDTSRFLVAGAGRVFWLRACRETMAEGYRAFLAQLAATDQTRQVIVAESNSLREVVRPGFFIMVTSLFSQLKESAQRVGGLADLNVDGSFLSNMEDARKFIWAIVDQTMDNMRAEIKLKNLASNSGGSDEFVKLIIKSLKSKDETAPGSGVGRRHQR
jgi:hypothetical protein